MAVKMRLTRLGDKKSPFYRVVVIDSHKARDGQYVDLVGTYNPLTEELNLDTFMVTERGICIRSTKPVSITGRQTGGVIGMSVDEAIERLSGIHCGPRPTSCPDQVARALSEYKNR